MQDCDDFRIIVTFSTERACGAESYIRTWIMWVYRILCVSRLLWKLKSSSFYSVYSIFSVCFLFAFLNSKLKNLWIWRIQLKTIISSDKPCGQWYLRKIWFYPAVIHFTHAYSLLSLQLARREVVSLLMVILMLHNVYLN